VLNLGVPLKHHLATAMQRVARGGMLCAHLHRFDPSDAVVSQSRNR
jgi:hypothetical protein